jgi:tetratricopeptide (TPR) repeat protein
LNRRLKMAREISVQMRRSWRKFCTDWEIPTGGWVNLKLGNRFCEESRALAEENYDTNTLLLALNRLGVLAGLAGDHSARRKPVPSGIDPGALVGNRERAPFDLNNLGALADEQGDYHKAMGYYRQAIPMAREIGAQQSLALYLLNLANSQIRAGDLQSAREHLREGLALSEHIGAAPWMLIGVIFFARLEAPWETSPRALELLGLAEHHPAHSIDHQRLTEQMLQ